MSAYLDHWLVDIKGEHGPEPVKPQSRRNYRIQLGHVIPLIGARRLDTLTAAHIEAAFIALSRSGVSASVRRNIHIRLKSALGHAVNRDYIARNPMDKLKMPKSTPAEQRVLTRDDVRRLVAAIPTDDYGALWHVLLRCGLRVSESFALTWDDIDAQNGVLHVTKQTVHLKGETLVTPPKTAAGVRDVPIFEDTLALLREHKRTIRLTPAWRHPELVFPSATGSYLYLSTVSRRWKSLLQQLDIPHATIHGMRHTFTTLAMEQGTDLATLQKVVGHARGNTTLMRHYLHARDDREREALRRIAEAMTEPQNDSD